MLSSGVARNSNAARKKSTRHQTHDNTITEQLARTLTAACSFPGNCNFPIKMFPEALESLLHSRQQASHELQNTFFFAALKTLDVFSGILPDRSLTVYFCSAGQVGMARPPLRTPTSETQHGTEVRWIQVRLVSTEAERPNHPSRGGGVASWGGGQPAREVASPGGGLHNNDNDDADVTP